jgi:hypothetical protein
MRSSSREAPAYAALIYSWFRIQIWNRFFNDLWFNPGRQGRSKSRGYGLTMNSSSTDLNYCGFPSVPSASIRCSSRFSSRSCCSFTSFTYSNWLAEATAGSAYPTVSAAGGTGYRSLNDGFGRERREARYYGSMGEDARLPGPQIGY